MEQREKKINEKVRKKGKSQNSIRIVSPGFSDALSLFGNSCEETEERNTERERERGKSFKAMRAFSRTD